LKEGQESKLESRIS